MGGIRQHEPCYEKTRVTTIDTLRQLGADFKVKKQGKLTAGIVHVLALYASASR